MVSKPQTLAEYLGMSDEPIPQPLAVDLEQIVDGKAFGLAVLNSVEFRAYILMGLRLGTLPGFTSILGRLIDHAVGIAPKKVEMTGANGEPIEHVVEVRRTIVRVEKRLDDDEEQALRPEAVH